MKELSTEEIRGSFVNCSRGEAKRMNLPEHFPLLPWEDMDFVGWRDPKAPGRAYFVAESQGRTVGIAMRLPTGSRKSNFMKSVACSLCLTVHPTGGVRLFSAPKPGKAGKAGGTIGRYVCDDLACSLYARGKRESALIQPSETITTEERVERLRVNVDRFVTVLLGHGD